VWRDVYKKKYDECREHHYWYISFLAVDGKNKIKLLKSSSRVHKDSVVSRGEREREREREAIYFMVKKRGVKNSFLCFFFLCCMHL
jgi:hypothetical protein